MTVNLNYDITQDALYKKGIELGIEQSKKETTKTLLQSGLLTIEQIANILKVSIDYVKEMESESA